ncbi:Sugar tr domain containing protein [Pyrenophora tritici-repentis]|nr:Sugar tr domain containing protein [Pyrenophora tritici-repentis]
MSHFGRRTLYLSGQTLTCLFVLLIGILACIPQPRTNTTSTFTPLNWSIAALLLAFTLTYDATLGPICYALVSEMPSTRLRSKTIVLARNCYNVGGIVTNVITPRMLNPTAWGWGAKTGFFWAGTSVLGLGWSFWRLPEPKGRTFGELDELFERGVAAREFGGWAAGDKSSVEGEGGVKEGV